MRGAEQKASQRAILVSLLSLGIAFGSAALTSDGASIVLYALLGIVIVASAVLGLYRRPLDWLNRRGGRRLAGFLAVFLPLMGVAVFVLYPAAVGFGAVVGLDIRTKFAIVAVISGVIALANLTTFVLNIIDLVKSRQATG